MAGEESLDDIKCYRDQENGDGRSGGHSADDREGRAEKNAEWQRTAFVKRSENEENENERHSEHDGGRDALLGFLFLIRDAEIIVAHFVRHGLPENIFERSHRLVRAITGRCGAVDLRRAIFVVPEREFRTGDVFDGRDRVERDGSAVRVANEELADVLRVGPVIAFRFDINLPGTTEAVEVIHEESAHECLERLINLAEIDSLFQHFVAIDVHEYLRDIWQKRRNERSKLRPFSRRVEKCLHVLRKKGDVFAGAIFQYELESTGGAYAGDCRRRKSEGQAFGQTGELFVNVRLDGGVLFFRLDPFAPGLERDEEERTISILHETEQTESDDAGGVLDPRNFAENAFDLARSLVSTFE